MKNEVKTKVTNASVSKFIDSIADEGQRNECRLLMDMMRKASKVEPKMWGSSIIGFDSFHYIGKSGREGDWLLAESPHASKRSLCICTAVGNGILTC